MKILCLSLVIAILSFLGGSNGIQISCSYNSLYYGPYSENFTNSTFYVCNVVAYDASVGSPDKIDTVVDSSTAPVSDVTMVLFATEECPDYDIFSFPQGLEEVFTNIRGLVIGGCEISSLNANDLVNYGNLELLSIHQTPFTVIPEGFLDPVQNTLIYLSFIQTQINKVAFNLLAGLTKLERAYFLNNNCIDDSATDPAGMPALNEKLNEQCPLSNGIQITCQYYSANFSSLSSNFLDPIFYFCNVVAYDVIGSSGIIDTVVDDSTAPVSDVSYVRIATNCSSFGITSVPQGLEIVFPNIRALYLATCGISTLNANDLSNYGNLEYLAILYSSIQVIPAGFLDPVPNLIYLSFSANDINEVEYNLLVGLTKLEKAFFSSNECINKFAYNPSEIPALQDELNDNCTLTCVISPTLEIYTCELQNQIQALQEKDLNFETAIEDILQRLDNSETSIADAQTAINNLLIDVDFLNQAVANVNTRVDDLETTTNDLEGRTTTLEGKTLALENEDLAIYDEIDKLSLRIAQLEADNLLLQATLQIYEDRLLCLEASVKLNC